jgi:hypothetical protein
MEVVRFLQGDTRQPLRQSPDRQFHHLIATLEWLKHLNIS